MSKFIFTADWHIRPDKPICRKDSDWLKTQEDQVDFVIRQSKDSKCPIIICGDVFHRPNVPDFLKNMLIDKFYHSNDVYVVAGNHDLQYHSWANFKDSSLAVLFNGVTVSPPNFGSYSDFGRPMTQISSDPIIFIHEPIFASEKDCPPNMKAKTADQIFDQYPEAKWILCGDIHSGFHVEKDGRHLIMAGCLNRQASDYKDYEPKIWLIDTDKNIAKEILVPDDPELITEEHLIVKKEKNERIESFVEKIKDSKTVTLDFEENVNRGLLVSNISKGAVDKVRRLME